MRLADVVDEGLGDGPRVVRLRDRASHDDVVGARRDGVVGRGDALLVVGGASRQADPRRDDQEAGPVASRMRLASWPEAMTPSKPDSCASCGAQQDEIGRRQRRALLLRGRRPSGW